jgi:hypothetical protein
MKITFKHLAVQSGNAALRQELLSRKDISVHETELGLLILAGEPPFAKVTVLSATYIASNNAITPERKLYNSFVLLPSEESNPGNFESFEINDELKQLHLAKLNELLAEKLDIAIKGVITNLINDEIDRHENIERGHKAAGNKYFRVAQSWNSDLMPLLDYLPHYDLSTFTGYKVAESNTIDVDNRVISHGSKANLKDKLMVSHIPMFAESAADVCLIQFLFNANALVAPIYIQKDHWLAPMTTSALKMSLKADVVGEKLLGTFHCKSDDFDYEIVLADSITITDDFTGVSVNVEHFYQDVTFEDAGYTSNLPGELTTDKSVIVITKASALHHLGEVVSMFLDLTDECDNKDEEAIYHEAEQLSIFIKLKTGTSIESVFQEVLNNLPESTRMLLGEQLLTVAIKDGQFSVEAAYS